MPTEHWWVGLGGLSDMIAHKIVGGKWCIHSNSVAKEDHHACARET